MTVTFIATGTELAAPPPNADYEVFWDERDYETSIDTTGLAAYWKLGPDKTDSSGNGHTLTTGGTPTHNQATCLRDLRVARADGVSNSNLTSINIASLANALEASSHADFDATTAVTVVASFTSGFAFTNRPIAAKTGVWVLKHDASGNLYFEVTTSSTTVRVTSSVATSLSVLHHAVGTYDASTGIVALYLDGVQVAVGSAAGNLVTNSNNVLVGKHSTNFWFGRMSHVTVYKNRAFTPRDVYASYSAALLQLRNPITGYNINATDGLGLHIYWLIGGGVVADGRLVILAADIQSTTSLPKGWMGFTCTDFSGDPDTWTWEECDVPAYADDPTNPMPTVSSYADGNYYYGIARNPSNSINWQLCRWPLADVADGDLTGAEWWDGANWSADPLDAADLMPDTSAGAGGWLWRDPSGTWVALQQVSEGGFVRTRGAIRTASTITGSWSAHEVVVTPPGFNAADNTKHWYAPSAHPEIEADDGVFVTYFAGGDTTGDPNWVTDHPQLGWYASGIIRGLPDDPTYEAWAEADDILVQVNDDDTFPTRYLGVGDIGDTVDLGDGRVLWLIGDNLVSGNDANRNRSTSAAGLRNALGLWTGGAFATKNIKVKQDGSFGEVERRVAVTS